MSFVIVVVLLAVGLALLVAVTVVPAVVSAELAERRGLSTTRWGLIGTGFALAGTAVAVLAATQVSVWVAVIPVLLTWAGPGLVFQIARGDVGIGGRPGKHS